MSSNSHRLGQCLRILGAAALVVGIVRLATGGPKSPQTRHWRELSGPDLR